MVQKLLNLNQGSEIVATPLCLGKDSSIGNDFNVDYDPLAVDDILDIHNYLIKKEWHSINKMFAIIEKIFITGMTLFSCNTLKRISVNNQDCKRRPQIININRNKLSFYLCIIEINKCSGSCS